MITWLITSTLSMGILLLFYHTVLIKEKMHKINRGYLLFSLVFSITIPFVPVGITGYALPFDLFTQSTVSQSAETTTITTLNFEEYQTGSEIVAPVSENNPFSWNILFPLLIAIYSVGAITFFVRLLRIIHMIQIKSDRNPKTLFEGYEVVLLKEDVIPHTFLSTIFVNKKQFEQGKIDRSILLHELAHAKQHHSLDILFVEILKCFLWLNPLVYLYKKAIHLNHEFLADEAVLTAGISVSAYQKTLLETILHKPSYSLASSLNFGLTKKRLQMMTLSINRTTTVMKILSLIPLFLVLALFLGCESTPSVAESSVDENISSLSVDEQNLDRPTIKILINSESEIVVDGNVLTLDELHEFLDEKESDLSQVISLRVSGDAEFGTILDVQKVLRAQGSRRINYSTIRGDAESELTRITQEYLHKSAIYMEMNTSEVSLSELENNYKMLIDLAEEIEETMQHVDFPPPPPPIPPSPHVRLGLSPETTHSETPFAEIETNNLLTILINEHGMMLANEEPEDVEGIKTRVMEFVDNRGVNPELSSSPQEAILSIRFDERLEYNTYISILDEIMSAYNELRDSASMQKFGVPFSSLETSGEQYREIRDTYPKRISIAEPAGRSASTNSESIHQNQSNLHSSGFGSNPNSALQDVNGIKEIELNEIVVTPENGIRPDNYTTLDLNNPFFKLEPIDNPPLGNLRFRPEDGFAEGFMNLRAILAGAFNLPAYQIDGDEDFLNQRYEFVFVHTGSKNSFYDNLRNKIARSTHFQIQISQQPTQTLELHSVNQQHKMAASQSDRIFIRHQDDTIYGNKVNMESFANFLTMILSSEVTDQTHLAGTFDIEFKSTNFDNYSELSADLEEQLGIALKPVIKSRTILAVR